MDRIRYLLALALAATSVSALSAQPIRPALALPLVSAPAVGSVVPERQPGPVASLPDGIVNAALGYIGAPYVSGGSTPQGVDCSGLVYRVFRDMAGFDLPRGVDALYRSGGPVRSPLHIGDLLFFDTAADMVPTAQSGGAPRRATHVGVYAGADRFVHAASEGPTTGVIVSRLDSPYYRGRFLGARRVISWRPPVLSLIVTDEQQSIVQASPFASREPIRIYVYNGMTGGGPLDLTILHDGRRVLTQRITPGALRPSELSMVPDAGEWSVRVNRIFKGRELDRLTFRVEE